MSQSLQDRLIEIEDEPEEYKLGKRSTIGEEYAAAVHRTHLPIAVNEWWAGLGSVKRSKMIRLLRLIRHKGDQAVYSDAENT